MRFEDRLNAISWGDFDTAYGLAVDVPDQLRRLAGSDRKAALNTTHDLWCGLCHHHVQVGPAALPAPPFLLEVLNAADREMTVQLLEVLLGFAIDANRQRVAADRVSLKINGSWPPPGYRRRSATRGDSHG
jgi:hypothetical protein